ncbi:hypothetical protein [Streptomyces varsoviensis]|uniref:Uncharacterized protein n=1 Tax=Streptomyces varsoviensis TaxID=67373 RepID=A0ABR5J5Y4_9ACTN|nr:hypothetical protein [Streptomyces varsoviensis]KOG88814.1 hypothetical protein ADK38_17695 [Streptomyces varsoviensis]
MTGGRIFTALFVGAAGTSIVLLVHLVAVGTEMTRPTPPYGPRQSLGGQKGPGMTAKNSPTCVYCQSLTKKLAEAERNRDPSAALDCRVLLKRHRAQGHPVPLQAQP